ncbi:hypothetical protein ABVT39_018973 [Epinephelus coioides]
MENLWPGHTDAVTSLSTADVLMEYWEYRWDFPSEYNQGQTVLNEEHHADVIEELSVGGASARRVYGGE